MKKRFSEEQIIGILKEQEAGFVVKDIIHRHGIAVQTFYRWKSKFGGMEVSDARRLRELQAKKGTAPFRLCRNNGLRDGFPPAWE